MSQYLSRVQSTYKGLNPIAILKHNYLYPQLFHGHHLLANTFEYTFDFNQSFSKDVYYTEATSCKFNLFYAHCYLMHHTLFQNQQSQKGYNPLFQYTYQFDTLLSRLIQRDHVFAYGTDFDPQIHDELKRMKRTVYRSLEDYFMYGNQMGRDINDIVYQEILGEKDGVSEEEVEKIAGYLKRMIKVMQKDKSVIYVMCNQEDKFNWSDIAKAAQ
ncbi:hypothetical protein FGO68_gene8026 [Halteria grandinella]|uniref:Uncharacterized protein n=1 Tax=Halteria grandinella TaxID=5974 RepID=A0A8J8P5V5_HALGN|nr:hypothetical protein FGO68_gene8026 [Halteria grandinella]